MRHSCLFGWLVRLMAESGVNADLCVMRSLFDRFKNCDFFFDQIIRQIGERNAFF